ncbi:hypothetical protein EOD39_16451 [Acipenser ruthenus]|uniref:CCHC-type domain-containing protein n=1 Tax=Acipenser ruthenus TaxID=7906 RepID=A0A444U9P6_ACIRT|nr:hypothetical protein EOD39_16451 [Acipenser ruthenus]
MEGAPMCGACGEFGHVREDCPYGDPQYEEAWNQGLMMKDRKDFPVEGEKGELEFPPNISEIEMNKIAVILQLLLFLCECLV